MRSFITSMYNILNDLDFVKKKRIVSDLILYSKKRFNVHFAVAYPQCKHRPCIFTSFDFGFSGRLPSAPKPTATVPLVVPSQDVDSADNRPCATLSLAHEDDLDERLENIANTAVVDVKPTSTKRFTHEERLLRMAQFKQEKRCRVVHREGADFKDCGLSTKKGTKNYNSKKYYSYLERVKALDTGDTQFCLLTLTGNQNDDNLSLIEVWDNFLKKLKLVVRHLGRDFHISYFYAIQSHEDFTPHVHFILALKGLTDYTLYDVLNDWLHNYWTCGSVDLRPISADSPIEKVTSYVCKELLVNIEDVTQKARKDSRTVTGEDYKALNTLYFIEKLRSKQFMTSKQNVSRETKNKCTDVQSVQQASDLLDDIDKDLATIENAIATGTFTAESDSAFYRLLGIFTPPECSSEWFFLSDTEKMQKAQQNNGSLVNSVSNRMRRHAEKTISGHCNLLPYFDKVVKNK